MPQPKVIRWLTISGDSMSPDYREGDFVLISKIPFIFFPLKPGDVVAFRHAKYGIMIKKISAISPNGRKLYVVGSHPYSVDSNRFGPIPRQDILGKVVWHVKKPISAEITRT